MNRLLLVCFSLLLMSACTAKPEGIEPVDNFDLSRYLGTWYEIARLDHSFERGLSQVTATYSLARDGRVRVLNKGFSEQKQTWSEAKGIAKFVDSPKVAHLKVSFFGPFYGAYVVFVLDKNYQYALVAGPNRDYLWILARNPEISPQLRIDLLKKAKSYGFDTSQLIFVEQRRRR
ncbi:MULTISPECIES: lipocalin family protein [unclassified Agarivorans]|uniref:lipocalin family protein n=1 Tax=unclassified Agarivorans TaxID=2636026 RepID=UPI003D7EB764